MEKLREKVIYVEVTVIDQERLIDVANFIENEIKRSGGSYKLNIGEVKTRIRYKENDWDCTGLF